MLGFIPRYMFEQSSSNNWTKASVCVDCGGLNLHEITEQEMDRAEKRFVTVLVNSGHMDKSDARLLLDEE